MSIGPIPKYSDYIVFVDESGDHNLENPDPTYPVFVLAFCMIEKADYISQVLPAVTAFKFRHFGHDMVILHEHAIRKATGPFIVLTNAERRAPFMAELNTLFDQAPFVIIAICVRKDNLAARYSNPTNPYHLALKMGLERVDKFLASNGQHGRITHVVFEARGRKEDDELELEFRRVCDGGNFADAKLGLEFVLADKRSNCAGLQVADLVARPIGLKVLRPDQPNRAYDIIEKKLDRSPSGQVDGYGLKCFP